MEDLAVPALRSTGCECVFHRGPAGHQRDKHTCQRAVHLLEDLLSKKVDQPGDNLTAANTWISIMLLHLKMLIKTI